MDLQVLNKMWFFVKNSCLSVCDINFGTAQLEFTTQKFMKFYISFHFNRNRSSINFNACSRQCCWVFYEFRVTLISVPIAKNCTKFYIQGTYHKINNLYSLCVQYSVGDAAMMIGFMEYMSQKILVSTAWNYAKSFTQNICNNVYKSFNYMVLAI